ncbi:MAG: alpha/beta hydrolase [Candidatus Protistobacter heckmanni]|nr:alpha/beta hydrolase [Candidatus Protistobacter heckmanni]
MNPNTIKRLIPGPAGAIELAVDLPEHYGSVPSGASWRGVALVAHPHPLFGGTMDNKVAQTLARSFLQLGYATVRPNFRGVGASEGVHDKGQGEQEDLLKIVAWMRDPASWSELGRPNPQAGSQPLAFGGFSFGTYVGAQTARRLAEAGAPFERLVLVGCAAGKWDVPAVPADTIVIHGELDDTIPLAAVLDWARPQDLPVTVIPGSDHFFHRRLHLIKNLVTGAWHASGAARSAADGAAE